ncbi:MAG: aspartate--tRNA(Asn) ligase [bacterium]|nr:aspartate--tRNA(Asn) ligase [bacterium]
MERIFIQNLKDKIGEKVLVAGFVDVRRDHGKLIFIDLRDKSGIIQTVVSPKHKDAYEILKEVRSEWVLHMTGIVKKRPDNMVNKDSETGDIEIEVSEVTVLNKAQELPFEKDAELNLDTYLDHLPLTLRSSRGRAIFKVQAEIIAGYREALVALGFTEFQAPKLVGDDAEGGGNVFSVDYFNDKKAYLATSPQLYKQIMVGIFERVFSTGNVFRAEKHSTTRHLNEYTSLDAELGFITDHRDVMNILTNVMHHIIARLKKGSAAEYKLLNAELPHAPKEFPFMKLREAHELIKKETGEDHTKEPDLDPADERWLCEYAARELNSDFIFITHYPIEKRPFYTHEDENDHGYTKSFDLLFRGVEITTGGQRVHEYNKLVEKIQKKGLQPENFSFYLEAFKYGMPPHGGFGMGLERLTQKFLGLSNVKEATLFPREINRIDMLLSQ